MKQINEIKIAESIDREEIKDRSVYYENLPGWNKWMMVLVVVIALSWVIEKNTVAIFKMQFAEWLLLLIFPAAGIYVNWKTLSRPSHKWSNAIMNGFAWSGILTVYPVLLSGLKNHLNYNPGWEIGVVFLIVFVLLSATAIFFQTRKVSLKRLLFQP